MSVMLCLKQNLILKLHLRILMHLMRITFSNEILVNIVLRLEIALRHLSVPCVACSSSILNAPINDTYCCVRLFMENVCFVSICKLILGYSCCLVL